MLIWAVICLVVGYGLNYAHITPIIKRIATCSFTLASLGWCLAGFGMLAIGGSISWIIRSILNSVRS